MVIDVSVVVVPPDAATSTVPESATFDGRWEAWLLSCTRSSDGERVVCVGERQ
jgi:hypothetical protein